MGAAIVETGMGASIELKRAPATKALGSGVSGWAMRSGASGSTAVLDASNKARPQLAARSGYFSVGWIAIDALGLGSGREIVGRRLHSPLRLKLSRCEV